MKKLIALYKTPADPDAFMQHYRETHLPLVRGIPGLLRAEPTLIDRTLAGEQGSYLLVQMEFADEASFKAALRSPENAAAGADVALFADGLITLMTGTVLDL